MKKNKNGLTKKQIEFLNSYTDGTWAYNPTTGLVDINGDFICYNKGIKNLYGIKFGNVYRDFQIGKNRITSLEGAPQVVGSVFCCEENAITSLEGAPQRIGESFYCYDNNLTSLEGGPQDLGGDYVCAENNLINLKGAPKDIVERFICTGNKLKSLEGLPKKDYSGNGSFICDHFTLDQGEWNNEGWVKIFNGGDQVVKQLVYDMLDEEVIEKLKFESWFGQD